MEESYNKSRILESKIRSRLLRRMVKPFFLILLCIPYFIWLLSTGLLNMAGFISPYDVKGSLSKIDELSKNSSYMTTISLTADLDDIVDTGIETTWYSIPIARYIAVNVEGKYILCIISLDEYQQIGNKDSYTFTGSLSHYDAKVASVIFVDMEKQGISGNDAVNLLYPFCIDPTQDVVMNRLTVYVPFILLLVFSMILTVRGIIPILDIKYYSSLKKLPDGMDPEMTLAKIEQQMVGTDPRRIFHTRPGLSVCLAKNWIIMESAKDVRFFLADVYLWAYKATKTGAKYVVNIKGRGEDIKVKGNEDKLDALLNGLIEAYPWILIGYTHERAVDWYNDIRKMSDAAKQKKHKIGFIDF